MKTINLPVNTETIKFTDLSKLIGIALVPEESELSRRCATSVWYEGDTVSAAYSGGLTVRNPLTRRPWPPGGFTSTQLLVEAVVTPDDLRHYLAGCGIEVVVAQESAQVPSAPPEVDTTPPETQPATLAEQRQAAIAVPAPGSEAQTAATPVMADSARTVIPPEPERRLARLRALRGDVTSRSGKWTFRGITALVASEKSEGRKRSDEKTIRNDLREAVDNEREARRAGFASGLVQR